MNLSTQASYADDGRLAGVDPIRLQAGLDFMTEQFARVGMKMNVTKTKAMICHNSTLGSRWSTPAYKRCLDGVGESSAQAKRHKVACPKCDAELQERSLARHILTWHSQPFRPAKHRRLLEEAERSPRMYHAFSPRYRHPLDCPVDGCSGQAVDRDALQAHFAYRHPCDLILIEPEGLLPHCDQCGMQVMPTSLHRNSKHCQNGKVRKRWRAQELQNIRDLDTTFRVGNMILENVDSFLYLSHTIAADHSD